MSNTKRRYYIFMGDLYKSQDGKDKKIREATERDKKKYGGIVADTITDVAEMVSGKPEKKKRKTPVRKTKSTEEEQGILSRIGQYFSEQKDKRTKTFGGSQGGMPRKRIGNLDYRKGGMVVNTVDNRKNK